jgi:uncharacterized protein with gpF-like domain
MGTLTEERMSWLQRLFQQSAKQAEIKSNSSTLSKSVKANLRRNVELIGDVGKQHHRKIYELALRSMVTGGGLHLLAVELMRIEGMSKERAADIARSLQFKASVVMERERRASIGITHATWIYANAPCMKNPFHPTDAEIRQDAAHRAANGKRYEISNGLIVDGKWTSPGAEDGCKCVSRAILPGLEQ